MPMLRIIADFAQYLGMPVKPAPMLDHGEWRFADGGIVVAHDVWEALGIDVYDAEGLLPDEEVFTAYEHR